MMTAALDPARPDTRADRRTRFAWRGVKSVGFTLVYATCVSLAFEHPFVDELVYSLCISLLCWFFIDAGRIVVARWVHRRAAAGSPESQSQWPGWPWMLGIVIMGSVAGYSLGHGIANRVLGYHNPGFFDGGFRETAALLLGALIPGTAITYWFYSRETIAAQEAAVLTAQRQAAEHQLKLLESQLEPHMLFNTLANLRVLIGIDPPRAQAMLDQLINFLRATLSASRSAEQTLAAEFARLADYLALMQIRMGDRLHTRFELPEALAATPVPPMLLQPLVENCIKHGLETKVEGGRIVVSASEEHGQLVLRVRDTGVGLKDASMTLNDANVGGTHFGLTQVRERLATLYGPRAALHLRTAGDAEGGTLATINLPITSTSTSPSA